MIIIIIDNLQKEEKNYRQLFPIPKTERQKPPMTAITKSILVVRNKKSEEDHLFTRFVKLSILAAFSAISIPVVLAFIISSR